MNHVRPFLRAAQKRRKAAEVLRRHRPPFGTDAIYLGGYAGECALKALILANLPVKDHAEVIEKQFRGAKAHEISALVKQLDECQVSWSPEIHSALRHLGTWSTDLRYSTVELDELDAESFLKAVDLILAWVQSRL